MGELTFSEDKKLCCLDCHNLTVHYYSGDLRKIDHRTWNETERFNSTVDGGRVICAEDEWSKEEEDEWSPQDRNTLTKDRSECPSYEEYIRENRYSYIERYRQLKKDNIDKRRFVILAVIGLASIFVGVFAICSSD